MRLRLNSAQLGLELGLGLSLAIFKINSTKILLQQKLCCNTKFVTLNKNTATAGICRTRGVAK